jgi:N-carbamoylputrescine amidase
LIQASHAGPTDAPLKKIREANIEKHLKFLDQAGKQGVKIICMQEIFTGPYFCAEQNTKWYDATEKIPDGPTTRLMQEVAKKHSMVIISPIYEEDETGVYYNTAAVIDADGTYLGKYRKSHIPHTAPGFWEKFYFKPGNLGYPVFKTQYADIGVYICYDRHFPEGARELGLNGAEIIFNPSATVAGLSEYLWKLEQPAHAVANVSASRSHGTLESSTGRATSAIRADKFSRRQAATRTSCSPRSSTWTRSVRSGTSGSSTATGDRRLTAVCVSCR